MKLLTTILAGTFLAVSATGALAEDLLSGHGFLKGTGWTSYVAPATAKAGGSVTPQEHKILVTSPRMDKQSAESIQILKSLNLVKDHRYVVKLKVNTDKAGKIVILYWGDTKSDLYSSGEIAIEPDKDEYELKFTVKASANGEFEEARSIRLLMGRFSEATVTLSDISIEEL